MEAQIIDVAGFKLEDLSYDDWVNRIVETTILRRKAIFFALHVGGLRLWKSKNFVGLINSASGVYADGQAIVLLARLTVSNAKIQRTPTTDLGFDVIRSFQEKVNRPARVIFIGGPQGLSELALRNLEKLTNCEGVFSEQGFRKDWGPTLSILRNKEPDFVFIGLGVPKEMHWCIEHENFLPEATIITCGGWFSFITGDEPRAPVWAQKAGLEWLWRLYYSPKRLWRRYIFGGFTVIWLMLRIIVRKISMHENS